MPGLVVNFWTIIDLNRVDRVKWFLGEYISLALDRQFSDFFFKSQKAIYIYIYIYIHLTPFKRSYPEVIFGLSWANVKGLSHNHIPGHRIKLYVFSISMFYIIRFDQSFSFILVASIAKNPSFFFAFLSRWTSLKVSFESTSFMEIAKRVFLGFFVIARLN